jgi:hypothetical protein
MADEVDINVLPCNLPTTEPQRIDFFFRCTQLPFKAGFAISFRCILVVPVRISIELSSIPILAVHGSFVA